jgi:hypothetical protein
MELPDGIFSNQKNNNLGKVILWPFGNLREKQHRKK